MNIRDNLLVTFGVRAGQMDGMGVISLPGTSYGEDEVAAFAVTVVDEYIQNDPDVSFDEHIETALEEKYGKENDVHQ